MGDGDFRGPGSGLFKSIDGGTTWRPLTKGLPTWEQGGIGRIGVTVAPTLSSRLYAVVEAREGQGIYRSDDAGESWSRVNSDPRVVARPSDAADIQVHPTRPDVVFVPTIVAWKSTDGGRTFTAFRGAPGGDDYQDLWINPTNPDVMAMASDQGAVVTLNGGTTWSSWYNQPTAAFYHVATDNAFPYRVCSGQQESGSACVASRGDHGQVTFRDWQPVGVEEYGYVAPDPLDPDIVYGGKVSRFDRRTGQVQQVGPRPLRTADYRVVRTAPVLFSPVNPKKLYFASQVLWQTTDGGQHWDQISPDLSRETWEVPASVGIYRGSPGAAVSRRGVIYTIAPSPLDERILWVDDGDHWQTLRVNMPATSIRDLVIKDDDLVVGTHGRSFWILDDITPLRQIAAGALERQRPAHLFTPQAAWRFRWNKNTDTPLPPDEPAGQNPPDGAVLHYRLTTPAAAVTLEILDRAGATVRRYSSRDVPDPPVEGRNTPDYWLRPPQTLRTSPGLHRFVWDLRHPAPAVASYSYPIAAIAGDTPRTPQGTLVAPDTYTVRLRVDGAGYGSTSTTPLVVRMDPRVKTAPAGLQLQYATSRTIDAALARVAGALRAIQEETTGSRGGAAKAAASDLTRLQGQATQLFGMVEGADLPPTPQMLAALKDTLSAIDTAIAAWERGPAM